MLRSGDQADADCGGLLRRMAPSRMFARRGYEGPAVDAWSLGCCVEWRGESSPQTRHRIRYATQRHEAADFS